MKKLLSMAMVLVLVFSLFAVIPVSAAADTPWVKQCSRLGSSTNGAAIDYTGFDWSVFGENLVPDPTVSHFDVGGKYGRYANMDSNYNPVDVNEYYWWDKPTNIQDGFTKYYKDILSEHNLQGGLEGLSTDEHGHYVLEAGKSYGNATKHTSGATYQVDGAEYQVKARSFLNFDGGITSSETLTAGDGTGALVYNTTSGAIRGIPLPAMQANKYYIIKFDMKWNADPSGNVRSIRFAFDYVSRDDLGADLVVFNVKDFAVTETKTVCLVVYSGSSAHSEPFAALDIGNKVYFDNFGMYEITSDYANSCTAGAKLGEYSPGEILTPWSIQCSRAGENASGVTFDYSDFDWSALGENLVPDPTVSHFDVGGEYGRYANMDSNYNPVDINEYYWWDKPSEPQNGFTKYYKDLLYEHNLQGGLAGLTTDEHGHYVFEAGKSYGNTSKHTSGAQYQVDGEEYFVALRSPLNWSAVKKPTEYSSITNDGSGVLRFNSPSSGGAYRHIPFPKMEADKYYVVKYNVKCTTSNQGGISLFLDDTTFEDNTRESFVAMGSSFAANGDVNVVCFLIYTGSNTYENPLASIYLMAGSEVFFDDFGMYEVSEEYASSCANATKLTAVSEKIIEPSAFQVSRVGDASGTAINYSNYDWSYLGENLIPDPEVRHFDSNGEYGKYATPDSNWFPTEINSYYWWDKYIEQYCGFIMYYQDRDDNGEIDKVVNGVSYTNGFQSPANRKAVKNSGSLSSDGSGVLSVSSSSYGYRGFPLPEMDADSYYVVKFKIKCEGIMNTAVDFCIKPDTSETHLINDDDAMAPINLNDRFAYNTADTACFVVYTGSKSYSNPFIRVCCTGGITTYLDDFGMYKVSSWFASQCSEGAALYSVAEEVIEPSAFQVSRSGNTAFDYSDYDWSAFGENLIPDPEVRHFDGNGEYGKYAVPNSIWLPTKVNDYYWWDKYIEQYCGFTMYYQDRADNGEIDKVVNGVSYTNGFQSPANRKAVKNSGSLTDDGSGVLSVSGDNAYRGFPLPEMDAESYYLVKFNIKCESIMNSTVEFCIEPNISNKALAKAKLASINLDGNFAYKKMPNTACFMVYTGSKSYSNPFIRIRCVNNITTYLDDFAVYKISSEYFNQQSEGSKLTFIMKDTDPWAIQVSRKPDAGGMIKYTDFDWSIFGDNLVPDPTVATANFTNGVYGKYATPDDIFKPANINTRYWWDKYIEEYNGFTMYYKDKSDNSFDKTVDGQSYEYLYRSPASYSNLVSNNTANSLTNDGSGVLYSNANYSYRAFPLPSMDINSYYLVKFNIKFNGTNSDPVELCLAPGDSLTNSSAISSITLGSALTANTVYTMAFVVYTGSNRYTDPFIRLKINNIDTYLDDFAVYSIEKDYADFCLEGEKLWNKQCDTTAYGYRHNYYEGQYSCSSANNLVANRACSDSEYWYSADGFVSIINDRSFAYESPTALKVSGSGTFKKLFTFEKNTEYYLSLWGMGNGDPISNIKFGFMDIHGHVLENRFTGNESTVFTSSAKNQITIQCQDGTWYNRVYVFNTGNVDRLYFFINGTTGTMYFDDIKIFKSSDKTQINNSVSNLTTSSGTKNDCDEEYNLIENGDFSQGNKFWGDFVGYGENVSVITSEGNSVLHFKGTNNYCYYLPCVEVTDLGANYTFTYWAKNISGFSTKYGVVSLNNPRGYIGSSVEISSYNGSWKQYSVTFKVNTPTKIAFAIFDVDGEAIFDNFKLFRTSRGTANSSLSAPSEASFSWTYLSITEGKSTQYKSQYENVDWSNYGESVYSDSSTHNPTTLSNGKKYLASFSTTSLSKYTYYAVSYSLKSYSNNSTITMSHYCYNSNQFSSDRIYFANAGTKMISMIICIGGSGTNTLNIEGGSDDTNFTVSNIKIYKLNDSEQGRMSIKEKRLFILGDLDHNLTYDHLDFEALKDKLLANDISSLAISDVNSDSVIDIKDIVRAKRNLIN